MDRVQSEGGEGDRTGPQPWMGGQWEYFTLRLKEHTLGQALEASSLLPFRDPEDAHLIEDLKRTKAEVIAALRELRLGHDELDAIAGRQVWLPEHIKFMCERDATGADPDAPAPRPSAQADGPTQGPPPFPAPACWGSLGRMLPRKVRESAFEPFHEEILAAYLGSLDACRSGGEARRLRRRYAAKTLWALTQSYGVLLRALGLGTLRFLFVALFGDAAVKLLYWLFYQLTR